MIVNGKLQLDIFKTVDGKKIKIGSFEDANKITLSGKQVMAYLMAGEPGNHKVSKFGVGTGSSFPDDYDTDLTNAYIRDLVRYDFLTDTIIQWQIALDVGEANGITISEFGLYSEDEQLFSRKIRTPGIVKDASISFDGAWTVWLLECKKTTFSSFAYIDFVISSPSIDYLNAVRVLPIIEHDITSSGNSERVIASQADIVSDMTSSAFANKDFTSTANIISSISDPVFDFTNVERRFSVAVNYFHEINDSLIFNFGDFSSQSDIESDITSDIIENFPDGDLIFIDSDNQGGTYLDVWAPEGGGFIVAACHLDGVRSYSVDGAGILTHIDTDLTYPGESHRAIWSDGSYIYVCISGDLLSYSIDGSGILTFEDNITALFTGYNDVWGDGTFVYSANTGTTAGLRSHTVDGGGNFTLKHSLASGGGVGVWGDGNFIYTATTGGLRSHTVDGNGILTQKDSDDQGGIYKKIWGYGNFIYVVCDNGVRSYSVDESGILTYISINASGAGEGIWGDGLYVYVGAAGNGIRSFLADGAGNLTLIDTDDQGGSYNGVFGDGTFIYTCATGLLSYKII